MEQENLLESIKEKCGISYLMPYQELIVSHIAENHGEGKDTRLLAVLPTGSGKSICFMLPILFVPGLKILVYPLLSLMSDQERRMKEWGIDCVTLKGGMDREERSRLIKRLNDGEADTVITNMETLLLVTRRGELRHEVGMLVLDEVHTAVTWGDSFRPSYQELPFVIDTLSPRHILSFTATMDRAIYDTVLTRVFKGRRPYIVHASADRPNIFYHAVFSLNKLEDLVNLMRPAERRPAVVFCPSREMCRETASFLTAHGLEASFYHAGLTKEERREKEASFFSSRTSVLCATSAYGMGVDKKDIRSVAHMHLPSDPGEFLQESGRAGRDGRNASSFILWNCRDSGAMRDVIESGKCIRKGLLSLMGEKDLEEGCTACSVCLPTPYRTSGLYEILRAMSMHPWRKKRNVEKRLCRPVLYPLRKGLSGWSAAEVEKAFSSLEERGYIRSRGAYATLTKKGREELERMG